MCVCSPKRDKPCAVGRGRKKSSIFGKLVPDERGKSVFHDIMASAIFDMQVTKYYYVPVICRQMRSDCGIYWYYISDIQISELLA